MPDDHGEDRRRPSRPFNPAILAGFLRSRAVLSAERMAAGKSNTNYRFKRSRVALLRDFLARR